MPYIDRCHPYKATKPYQELRYGAGQKYCTHCALFVNWEGVRCPCCNYNLKYKARNLKFKMEVQWI